MTGGRDLSPYLDRFGHIKVTVDVGGHGAAGKHGTGANGPPALVAKFLRELADDVERTGKQDPS